nr:exonuclease domain-containing protein [Auritidibacter ignavus]
MNEALQSIAPRPDQPWHCGAMVGFDLETTGRDPRQARIVTASLVVVDPQRVQRANAEWLLNPGVEIPAEATAVHGISTEYAHMHGTAAREGVDQIAGTLADFMAAGFPVVAYNGVYDFTVLTAEIARHGLETLTISGVVDPYVLDKQVDTYRKGGRTLGKVAEIYQVRLDNAHASAADALAGVEIAYAIAEKYPKLSVPLSELFELQKRWKSAQAESFEAYLRRSKDPEATVSRHWPVEDLDGSTR